MLVVLVALLPSCRPPGDLLAWVAVMNDGLVLLICYANMLVMAWSVDVHLVQPGWREPHDSVSCTKCYVIFYICFAPFEAEVV